MMPQQFAFVSADHTARIRSPERLVIRRHCMRQKNKKPNSRRAKREAARGTGESSHRYADRGPEDGDAKRSRVVVVAGSDGETVKGRRLAMDRECMLLPPPSDWALFPFAEELNVPSQILMHQYYERNPIRDMLYPFRYFGISVDFDEDSTLCFQRLGSDQLYLGIMLLLSSASQDLLLGRPLSNMSLQYLRRLIRSLNHRLTSHDAHRDEIILYVVSALASIAILFGEYNAAQTHAKGLSEIIRLRGDFGAVASNTVIQLSIDRLNFSSLLVTRLWTPLYNSSVWKFPILPAEIARLHRSQDLFRIDELVERDLAAVYRSLQNTMVLLNHHFYEKTAVDGSLIRQCLGFIHSKLLELEGRSQSTLSECLRLGMMTFLATTFRLPGSSEQHYCKGVAHELQRSYAAARASNSLLPKMVEAWLIMVLFISNHSADELDERINWEGTDVLGVSWDETRRDLKRVLWIDSFHDELGRRTFDVFQRARLTSCWDATGSQSVP